MKSLAKAMALALVLSAPVVSFAQSVNHPLTRADVRADLERVERAGYNPADWIHYPQNIQAAEARIAAEDAARGAATPTSAAAEPGATGVGGMQPVAESGHPADVSRSTYSVPVYEHQ